MWKINSIKDVISKEIVKSEYMKKEILNASWDEIVGKLLSSKSEPSFIKNGILYVTVENSVWLQQMNFLKNDIIEKINNFLNGKYVIDIIYKSGKKKNENYFSRKDFFIKVNRKEIEDISLKPEDIFSIKKSISTIKDPDLKSKLYNVYVRNKKKEIYYMKQGFKKCNRCGIIFEGEKNICIICENIEKKDKLAEIYGIIMKKNSISYLEAKFIKTDINEFEFEQVKKKIKDEFLYKIKILLKEKKPKEAFEYCIKYFKIENETDNVENLISKAKILFESFT